MGCGTSRIKPQQSKSSRRDSHVTMESQQRTVAAYRRQRIARDLEQDTYLRAEAEVEKALMLKRNSVDERRPSYILRVLGDLEEIEEGQEETEEKHPVSTVDSSSEGNIKNKSTTSEHLTTKYQSSNHESEYFTHKNEHQTNESEDDTNEKEDTITHEHQMNANEHDTITPELHANATEDCGEERKNSDKNESESIMENRENCANTQKPQTNSEENPSQDEPPNENISNTENESENDTRDASSCEGQGVSGSTDGDHVIERLHDKNENKINETLELNTTDVLHDNSTLNKDVLKDSNALIGNDIEANDKDNVG